MIPKKIIALFEFIDYLDMNKREYIEKYIPLCNELNILDNQRKKLKPHENYIDKQQYDIIQNQIEQKFLPITSDIFTPITNKLRELEIWSGDVVYSSIWNNNISVISDFKRDFTSEDVDHLMQYKQKYLSFRTETNTDFLCLSFVFHNIDEILKELFNFFKDSKENEFDSFEAKIIKVNSLEKAAKGLVENIGKNVKFSIPTKVVYDSANEKQIQTNSMNIKNEIIMGDKIQLGDINSNTGPIIIGKDIIISNSFNDKKEIADKIEVLLKQLQQEKIVDDQVQSLITNLDKIKEEIIDELQPDKSKIFKWLTNIKKVLENVVLANHTREAINWIYKQFHFFV